MLQSYFYSPTSTWLSGCCEPQKQMRTKPEAVLSTQVRACSAVSSATSKQPNKFFSTEDIYVGKSMRTSNTATEVLSLIIIGRFIQFNIKNVLVFPSSLEEDEIIYLKASCFLFYIFFYKSTYYLKSFMRFLWIFMQKSSTVVLQ